jgi:3-methyladenine DNA glycosylase AlkD
MGAKGASGAKAGTVRALRRDIRKRASRGRATTNRWFFKTGPGEYGAGDRFLGVSLPDLHKLAGLYQPLSLEDVARLLKSRWHEERLLALLILVRRYARGDDRTRDAIHRLYLRSTRWINNWDLVDCSAAQIVGAHLEGADRRELRRLATSRLLWERRIAMIATYHYIKQGHFEDALAVAKLLLNDQENLIHKAVGWMLREVGKRDRGVEERFLRRHGARMPRMMLRYAIERFPEPLRRRYLEGDLALFWQRARPLIRTSRPRSS